MTRLVFSKFYREFGFERAKLTFKYNLFMASPFMFRYINVIFKKNFTFVTRQGGLRNFRALRFNSSWYDLSNFFNWRFITDISFYICRWAFCNWVVTVGRIGRFKGGVNMSWAGYFWRLLFASISSSYFSASNMNAKFSSVILSS